MTRTEALVALDLTVGFSAEDLKSAYRKKVLQWHPDRNKAPGAGERFQLVKEAYDLLQKPEEQPARVSFREAGYDALFLSLRISLEILVNGGSVSMRYEGKTCDLAIPMGTIPGTTLLVRAGAPDQRDLRVLIEAEPHPLFDVRGIDLAIEIEVPASTEDLEVDIPTLKGSVLSLPVAPSVQSGAYLRYEGGGLRPGGDLYVFIRRLGALAAPRKQPGALETVLRSTGLHTPSQKPRSRLLRPKRS